MKPWQCLLMEGTELSDITTYNGYTKSLLMLYSNKGIKDIYIKRQKI